MPGCPGAYCPEHAARGEQAKGVGRMRGVGNDPARSLPGSIIGAENAFYGGSVELEFEEKC